MPDLSARGKWTTDTKTDKREIGQKLQSSRTGV